MPERQFDDFAGQNLKGAVVGLPRGARQVDCPGRCRRTSDPPANAGRCAEARRRGRHDQHRQPEEHGHPLGALDARAAAAVDVARRSVARRRRGAATGGDDEPGARGQAVRRIGPHASANCSRWRTRGRPLPRFALPAAHQGDRSASTAAEVESQNVAGDPARIRIRRCRTSTSCVSAHLDHLGVGGAVNGDTIYNGAMDNAVGHRRHPRSRRATLHESRREARPLDPVRRGHRRGEGRARIALFRGPPDGAAPQPWSPT